MFKDEQFYEAKVFLKSYADAVNCIKETAQKEEELAGYERMMNSVMDAKNRDQIEFKYDSIAQGRKFKDLKEFKLFQFSNYIFKNYFDRLESSRSNFKDLKATLEEGYSKMKADLKQ